MNDHLTDEQLAECLAGEAGGSTLEHLRSCPVCTELAASLRTLRTRRDVLLAQGERRARARTMERLRSQRAVLRRRLLAAAAVAVLVLGLVPSHLWVPPPDPGPDAHDVLLLEVERSLRRQVPSALEPAAWLVAELDRDVSGDES